MKHLFQRHAGLLILTVSLAAILVLLYLLRNIALPFLVGLVLMYILLPAITWVENHLPKPGKWSSAKRVFAIILVFALIVVALGSAGYYVVTATLPSFIKIVNNAPEYITQAFDTIQNWLATLRQWLPAGTDQQVNNFINSLGEMLGTAFRSLFTGIISFVPSTITYVMGFAALPVFLFYILKDHERLNRRLYAWLPDKAESYARDVTAIVNRVIGGYVRAQLAMGVVVGVLALIGLLIVGAPLAVGLAAIAGVTEMVPVLGPWIGGTIVALVVLALEPSKVIWVIVVFFVVQLLENNLLVPRIHGHYLHIHPAAAIVLIVAGAAVAGFWGLIFAIPLASTVVSIYAYMMTRAKEQDTAFAQGDVSQSS